eukprot:Em0022g972a
MNAAQHLSYDTLALASLRGVLAVTLLSGYHYTPWGVIPKQAVCVQVYGISYFQKWSQNFGRSNRIYTSFSLLLHILASRSALLGETFLPKVSPHSTFMEIAYSNSLKFRGQHKLESIISIINPFPQHAVFDTQKLPLLEEKTTFPTPGFGDI